MAVTTTNNYSQTAAGSMVYSTKPLASGAICPMGTMVSLLNGQAIPSADTAGSVFWGVANGDGAGNDNANQTTGSVNVQIMSPYTNPARNLFGFNMANPTAANVGAKVYVLDNQTVGLTSTNGILVGRIESVLTSGPNGNVLVAVELA